jgi:hypothetical protein
MESREVCCGVVPCHEFCPVHLWWLRQLRVDSDRKIALFEDGDPGQRNDRD